MPSIFQAMLIQIRLDTLRKGGNPNTMFCNVEAFVASYLPFVPSDRDFNRCIAKFLDLDTNIRQIDLN